ncbi:MAG: precorrin-3B C(17)-methyltransferase [Eubacteriaceae bacterium]|nr:precorrin-3B C(17)-methyltransferase [Eubacteriaceae bacterium]
MKKLSVVGIGPGSRDELTYRAYEVLDESDIICGYTVYVDLVKDMFEGKEFFTTGMMKETDRCKKALEKADEGYKVSLVCSGDSGVYGMAGLIYELAEDFPEVAIEIIPGITAAISGGSVLGAPVGHDFAVISLSDHLTDMALIEKRVRLAGEGDFIIVLYNPSSKTRKDYLKRMCDILLESRSPENVCGWVRNISREGEEKKVMTLAELREEQVDMFTTVFIGSSKTKNIGGLMVTPRGYIEKYGK